MSHCSLVPPGWYRHDGLAICMRHMVAARLKRATWAVSAIGCRALMHVFQSRSGHDAMVVITHEWIVLRYLMRSQGDDSADG